MLLKNLKILTLAGRNIECGAITVKQGKITGVTDKSTAGRDEATYDLTGCCAMPGLIDAHSHCGLHELDHGSECDDTNESFGYNNAHIRALDGFSYYDSALKDAVKGGVTSVCITPGSLNVINGQMSVVKTSGTIVDERIINPLCGIKAALGENTKGKAFSTRPVSRMGIAASLREAIQETLNYISENKSKKNYKKNLKLEALRHVVENRIPLRVHAHRGDDICTAIRIADEFGLKITLEHGTSAHLLADYIAKKGIPVVAGPFLSTRKKSELVDRDITAAGILEKHGVKVALTVDHPVIPIESLLLNAVLAHKSGMSYLGALKAVTINAAEICGCSDRIGSIEKGKDADIIVFNGDPLDLRSRLVLVIQDGEIKYNEM